MTDRAEKDTSVPDEVELPKEAEKEKAAGEPAGAAVNAKGKSKVKRTGAAASMSRRSLIVGTVGTVCLLGLGSMRALGHTPVPRPPGGQDEAHLIDACIRCEKCYEVCPRKAIKPCHIESGPLGMRTPMLDFDVSYCDFCTEENGGTPLCVKTCPTSALVLPEDATWQSTIIGVAEIDERQCLAYRDTGCHFCVDACPQQAILYRDSASAAKALRPYVVTDLCNGCGACQSVCVSLTAGSIAEGAKERAIVVKCL